MVLPADIGFFSSGRNVLVADGTAGQGLTMGGTLFNSPSLPNQSKFAIEIIYKLSSLGSGNKYFYNYQSGPSIYINPSTGQVGFQCTSVSGLRLFTYSPNTTQYQHLLCYFDVANGTPADRMKVYRNGTQVTVFDSSTNPTGAITTVGGSSVAVLRPLSGSGTPACQLFRASYFSNSLPAFSDLVSTSTRQPKPVYGVTGVFSVVSAQDGITYDRTKGQNWVNQNGITSAATPTIVIPT